MRARLVVPAALATAGLGAMAPLALASDPTVTQLIAGTEAPVSVSGPRLSWTAEVTTPQGLQITRVEFVVDGQVVDADGAPPFRASTAAGGTYDTTLLADGWHRLAVRATWRTPATGATTREVARVVYVFNGIDAEPPSIALSSRCEGPEAVIEAMVADNGSGLRSWSLAAGPGQVQVAGFLASPDAGGPIRTSTARLRADALASYAASGRIALTLRADDMAGQVALATTSLEAACPSGSQGSAPADSSPTAPPEGSASSAPSGSAAALPGFAGVTSKGLRSPQAVRYVRAGSGQRVPWVNAVWARRMVLSGRLVSASGTGVSRATVYLLDPSGRSRAVARASRTGVFRFEVSPRASGVWRAVAIGEPKVVMAARVLVRPIVSARLASRELRGGEDLVVTGRVIPRRLAARKTVQLQWRRPADVLGARARWSVLEQTRTDAKGRYRLRYRLGLADRPYGLLVRVVVPSERGWPLALTSARVFRVRVV